MARTLFIGDSHTCGYKTVPGKVGPGSYSVWNDNSYVDEYVNLHNKKAVVYSMPGANNRTYADWLGSMFKKYDDIDEVIILMSSLNRFMLGFNEKLSPKLISKLKFVTAFLPKLRSTVTEFSPKSAPKATKFNRK